MVYRLKSSGECLDWTNDTGFEIPKHTPLLIGGCLAVNHCTLAPGECGTVYMSKEWCFEKVVGEAIPAFSPLWLDTETGLFTAVNPGDGTAPVALSTEDASAGDQTVNLIPQKGIEVEMPKTEQNIERSTATGPGTIPAGCLCIKVENLGDGPASFAGDTLNPGECSEKTAVGENACLAEHSYDATGTTLRIECLRPA